MTNQPADEQPLAPPAPPPGPLWPEAGSEARASDGDATPDAPSAAPTSGPAAPTSGPAAPTPGSTQGPPPGSGAPFGAPPPGGQFPPGFLARYGLVRPVEGRYFAGVCASIGRATNTDPVLWRVLFAVLTLFGGVGLLAYLIGWLLIPADGDTASPIEAVLGRGVSRTSAPVAVIGAVV